MRSGAQSDAPGYVRDKNGAGGENRTHDLPLTKGLRYHYATPAANNLGRQPHSVGIR